MDFGTHLLSYLSENVDLLFLILALVALLLKPVPLKGVDKRFLYAGIGISFALSLTSYTATAFPRDPAFIVGHLVAGFLTFALQPAVILFLAFALEPRRKIRLALLTPLLANVVVYQICFYSNFAFFFSNDGSFHPGRLGYSAFAFTLLSIAAVLYEVFRHVDWARKRETIMPFIVGTILLAAAIFDLIGLTRSTPLIPFASLLCMAIFYFTLRVQETAHDPLTGLYNRQAFFDDEKTLGPSVNAIASIDLNGLKRTNDTLGHSAGDAALKDVADAIFAAKSKTCYAYRVGGDEFVILFTKTTEEETLSMVRTFKETLAKKGHSVSLGLAFRSPGESPAALLKRSDEAMYAEKSAFYRDSPFDRRLEK